MLPDPMTNRKLRLRGWLWIVAGLCLLVALAGAGITVAFLLPEEHDETGLSSLETELSRVPPGDLSADESNNLRFLREGLKLSRDLYTVFAALWGSPTFAEIAANEQVHLDATALLMARYGLTDKVASNPVGVFDSPQIQSLYDDLRGQGESSLSLALQSAAALEELDILDRESSMTTIDSDDLLLIYRALLRATGQHLWDLARAVERFTGEAYSPRYLDPFVYEELMAAGGEVSADALLLRAAPKECGKQTIRRLTRRLKLSRSPTSIDALRTRLCSSDIDIYGSPVRELVLSGTQVNLQVLKTSRAQFPSWVDSNSPAVWSENVLSVFNSSPDGAFLTRGESTEALSERRAIDLPLPERPGTVWIEAVWRDPSDGTLYGWYHFEPADLPCYPLTAPLIGAAVSYDGGASWEDRGFVIENGFGYDCSYNNGYFVGGNGDFTVIVGPEGRYFYFLFSNYIGPADEIGVNLARSAIEDRGQPGTVTKYYRGGWDEPGLGGRATAIFTSSTGWRGPRVEAFWGPSVHWNAYLGSYVALLNHTNGRNWEQEGIYIVFSRDLVTWTTPEKVLKSNDWYPQVMGMGAAGTDSAAGRFMRVYVGGVSTFLLEFTRRAPPS